jgi:hypothetical protein
MILFHGVPYINGTEGRAIAQAVSRRLLTAEARVQARSGHAGFVMDKVGWPRFPRSTSVSPANSHSTDCFIHIIIYHPRLVQ